MCGRYILRQAAAAEREFALARVSWQFTASYNIAPTQSVPVVRMTEGVREGVALRWGLIPFFARGEPPKYSTINARIETIASAASYRGPWKRGQRCIQLASGFYEWHLDAQGSKIPYFIHLVDQELFGFAALWDRSLRADATAVESCALITMPGNALMRDIHNTGSNPHRMPAILRRESREAWLSGTPEQAHAALEAYPADLMVAYAVSTRVNSPKNDEPSLIEPRSA
ncbi:MAG TPA: SOS response-associated peptidase [Steroidobacteraceae bacterium]|nr:SOS response-associated peptidase [Steroidobacteraceae bacterium]